MVRRHLHDGRAHALPPSAPLTDVDIDAATHIVGTDSTGADGGCANRCCRPQQRYLDFRGIAAARRLRSGRRVAHGEDPCSGSMHDSDVYGGQQYAPLLGLEVPG